MKAKSEKLRILVASGVNLDLLGLREPEFYGAKTLDEIHSDLLGLRPKLEAWFELAEDSVVLDLFQTNDEPSFLNKLQPQAYAGILVNAGAWTHTSLAIADRLRSLQCPYLEVHLSEPEVRESYRHRSLLAQGARGRVSGFKASSYRVGLFALLDLLHGEVKA